MKKIWILGASVLMAVGMAGAQADAPEVAPNTFTCGFLYPCPPPTTTDGDSVNITPGGGSSSLTENISVSIPKIVAMHLHEKKWSLDLGNEAAVKANCYRAGGHNVTTGRDEVNDIAALMNDPGTTWTGDGVKDNNNAYSFAGTMVFGSAMTAAPRYPGIEYTTGTNNKVTWKGPIVCFNRKVVEKFSNGDKGWNVSIKVNPGVTAGFPTLIVGDRVAGTSFRRVETLYNAAANPAAYKTLSFTNTEAGMGKTTGGWLDDYILEALVFDGNETAGSKSADVVFTLTGNF